MGHPKDQNRFKGWAARQIERRSQKRAAIR
jgi:hypothetical protein